MKRLQGDRSRKVSFFQEEQTKNNKHFYNISFFFDIVASSGSNQIENSGTNKFEKLSSFFPTNLVFLPLKFNPLSFIINV